MPYLPPDGIDGGPRWQFQETIYDSGDDGWSVAMGLWEEVPAIGIRWNGSDDPANENNLGYPNIFGQERWFILPREIREVVAAACRFLDFIRRVAQRE